MRIILHILCLFCISPLIYSQKNLAPLPEHIRLDSIQIVRDRWGVPHIYSPTDIETAYGFAWATCEDDFETLQKTLLIAKSMLGRLEGVEGAKIDFVGQFLDVKKVVEEKYETSFSDKFKQILEAYTLAVNRYAALHPKEVLIKKAFPATPKDVVQGFVLGLSVMSSVQNPLMRILGNELPPLHQREPSGSNAFAVHSSKTDENKNFIAINSHQPLEGPFSWYEVHLNSNEGMNILGGSFPGVPIIGHGVNEKIAWAHTLNYHDFYDIFKLEMHPKKKNLYKFDNEYKELEVRKIKLKVKLAGLFTLGVSKKAYRSIYGPTLRNKTGFYSVRMASFNEINGGEQWYKMNKAQSFSEFKEALEMQALPSMNIIFSDLGDTIYFISNGLFPHRNPKYDWKKVVPGNTSETLWEHRYFPLDSVPQYINPAEGYLFNANNSPYYATCDVSNLCKTKFNKTFGIQTEHTNRSARFEQLFADKSMFSYQDFKTIKYDKQYPDSVIFILDFEKFRNLDTDKYPDLKDIVNELKAWNLKGDKDSKAGAYFAVAFPFVLKMIGNFYFGEEQNVNFSEEDYAILLRKTKKHILKYFGTLDVTLGQVQRLRRGNVDLPLAGLPDVITAMYSAPRKKDGTLAPWSGESYIMLVKMGKDGPEIETVNAFGASNKKDSPHYTDQMEMFTNEKLKPMTLDKKEIFENAQKIYSPQ